MRDLLGNGNSIDNIHELILTSKINSFTSLSNALLKYIAMVDKVG